MEKKEIRKTLMEHVIGDMDILQRFTEKEGKLIRIDSWGTHEIIGFYFDEPDWFTVQHRPYGKVTVRGLAITNDLTFYIGEIWDTLEVDLMILAKLTNEDIDRIMELCYKKIKS